MDFLKEATAMKETLVGWRRHLHENPEVGADLPNTVAFVEDRLREMGYAPKRLGGGVTALAGKKEGKTILLRADMDALPMKEESGLPFSSPCDCAAHCCGHDLHTSMLLGAAKLLKEHEDELEGQVKFMFQPGEEVFKGAKQMVEAGILENPRVDAAFGMHVYPFAPAGVVGYGYGNIFSACFGFKITIKGRGSHGSMPENSIDPINIAVHIHLALQELISRESNPGDRVSLTIGYLNSGQAENIIPETAVMGGTLRTYSNETREYLKKRIREVSEKTADLFRGAVDFEVTIDEGSVYNEKGMTDSLLNTVRGISEEWKILETGGLNVSEDFAELSDRVPSTFFFLATGFEGKDNSLAMHNPKILFNEDALAYGTAIHTACACQWLKDNSR